MPKKQSGVLGSSPCLNSLASVFSSVKWGLRRLRGVLSGPIAGGAQQAVSPAGSPSSRAPGQPKGHFITGDRKGGSSEKPKAKEEILCVWRTLGRGAPPNPVPKKTAEKAEGGSFKKKTMFQ